MFGTMFETIIDEIEGGIKCKKTLCHGHGTDNVVGHAHPSSITRTTSLDL